MHAHTQNTGCRLWMMGGSDSFLPPINGSRSSSFLFRLWRRRSRRRSASVSPSKTRLRSRPAGGPARLGQTGHPRRSPKAPRPRQPALRTSLQPPVPHLRLRHRHQSRNRNRNRSKNRNRLQTHQQSTGSPRTAALLEENQSHHPEVGGGRRDPNSFHKTINSGRLSVMCRKYITKNIVLNYVSCK